MGTKLVNRCVEGDNMETLLIPPGFDSNDNSKTFNYLKRRPAVKYNPSGSSSGDQSEEADQGMRLMNPLPKGIIRGCEACKNCQRVTAKWHPEEARRPNLEDAPVFYPSIEEFEDTLKYISSIRSEAEKFGICRIVPPPSWRPPCPLKERDIWQTSKFNSRIQRIDKLQNRESLRKTSEVSHDKSRKKRRCHKSRVGNSNCINEPHEVQIQNFGFEPGPDFTLDAFQKYADDFKTQYFRKNDDSSNTGGNESVHDDKRWEPSVDDIEGEYWRMVEKPTEEIEVLYGADVETGSFGSGFPKNPQQVTSACDVKYINSGWNLNNFPRLPGSVLSFESTDISGVLVPWLYIGMCFSSFCWHVEDHHLYSLNYMHWGASKLWYGVPGSDALRLEAAMRKHLPYLFEEQPDLLHKLVTQLSPSILISEGVPVYRCVQNPGEFVLTFPRAYHAGFNCGFNCAEAVNVAPVDWLPHGQNAVELYREQGRRTSISHDKLLFGAAREAVKANWEYNLLRNHNSNNLRWKEVCGKDGILSNTLKTRVEMERVRRDFLCKSSQSLKMESSFDADSERECCVCLFDLHLSAAGCHHCSPRKYACLNHAKQLCSCSWSAKFFLFRYDTKELKILVEALEGKLSAVYRWARLDLGLALSSYVSKDKLPIPEPSRGLPPKEVISPPKVDTSRNVKPLVVVLALEKVEANHRIRSRLKSSSTNPGPENKELIDNKTSKSGDTRKKLHDEVSGSMDSKAAVSNPSVVHSNNLDGYYRQNKRNIVKLVRRISRNVELLEFGAVRAGKLWCDSRAIYPNGFRSRVKYIDVVDPTNICYYVSEILDAGRDGPFFMVYVEHSPDEVFIHESAARCWEMVRERVNYEITKQLKLERENLPPLQPPGSLDGMEMFGFFSQAITQVIQSMDINRVCTEYWESRPLTQTLS